MPYALFNTRCPRTAEDETRSLILQGGYIPGLPSGQYSFLEMYREDRGCDCRRVFFCVLLASRVEPQAGLAWGWESPASYREWFHRDDPEMIAVLKGPVLNPGSPQSELAPALLTLVDKVLLQDQDYVDRIKRHYALFRSRVEGGPEAKHNRTDRKKKRRR